MWTLIVSVVLFCVLQVAEADYCPDGSYCTYDCCYSGYYYQCCSVSVVYAWWFWFVWGLFFLLMVISCGCALRRRSMAAERRRNVVVVRSYPGYGSTVVSPEVPQYPYSQYPGQYAAVPNYNQGYAAPPTGYAQPPTYTAQPPQGAEQNKPPPYNPSVDTPSQNQT